MNPSSPTKIGLAFAAGVAVALASAVVYIKFGGQPVQRSEAPAQIVHAMSQPEILPPGEQKAVVPTPPPTQAEQKPQAAEPPQVTMNESATAPKPQSTTPRVPVSMSEPAIRAPKPHRSYPQRASIPTQSTIRVQVSQVKPPAPVPAPVYSPVTQPVPVRTVSEDQAPPVPQSIPPANLPPQPNTVPLETRSSPAPPQPHVVTLQAGTNITVRLGETLSTDHNYSGDTFRATLDSPIVMDGFIIAERGSKVLGKVVTADKAGKFEGVPSLQLVLTEISTTDGQHVRVETAFVNKKGQSNTRSDAEKIGGGAALGAIIGAIAGGGKGAAIGAGAGGAAGTGAVMLGKGKAAVIANETRLTFQLSSPATITERLN